MNTKTRNGLVAALAVVILGIVGLLMYKSAHAPESAPDTIPSENQTTEVPTAMSKQDRSKGSATTEPILSYEEALVVYKDRRIEFGPKCETNISAATFKNGTVLMLDNHSDEDRVFHLGSMGDVSIKAHGFKFVRFVTPLLPNGMAIDCAAHQNVAIITIQK